MTTTIRAAIVHRLDGDDRVRIEERPGPTAEDMVHIEVHAAGVGFPDLLMSRGEYQLRQDPPFVLGWEAAGRVVKTPPGSGLNAGDQVCALGLGAYAETMIAPSALTFPTPAGLSMAEAAAFPMNYLTALFSLERRGRLVAGETVLVQGAAGGTGSAAIQVARALGAKVIAVVSTKEKAAFATALGAEHVVVLGDDWTQQVKELSDGGVDVVFDPVGGDRLTDALRTLRPEGRLLIVGFAEGSIPQIAANRLLLRNIDVAGSGWNLLLSEPDGASKALARLATLDGGEAPRPPIGTTFAFDRVAEALAHIQDRRSLGKTILEIKR